ncbi:MAG: exosortase A [Rhodanobacteraceae bacterium]
MNRPLVANEARIPLRTRGWTLALAAFAVVVVILLAGYWQTVESLTEVWAHSGTYQYAFLIFPLSAWVAFSLRDRVVANPPAPSVWGLLAVGSLVFIWYAGRLLDVNLAQHFAFVAVFPALILACWGWRALWVLAFPLGYLVVFAVPWGGGLVGPLQDITARFAVRALELTGTPVLLNGREIITPSATWMVEDACSGVKFFAACTALGCLYAWLMYRHWWKRVSFVVLSAVVPVIANGLRVYFTVLIGETFGLKYATGTDHMVFGWQFFGTVLVLLLLVGWFFRDRLIDRELHATTATRSAGARSMVWVAAMAILVAGPVAAMVLVSPVSSETLHLAAPAVAGWNGSHAAGAGWRPSFHGAADEVRASYEPSVGGTAVELFHAVYTGRPRRGHSLITYGNDLYDQKQERALSYTNLRVELDHGRATTAGEFRLSGDTGSRLVWYWYCVDSRCTRSAAFTKLLQAWEVLRGHVPRSSVWALSSTVANGDVDRTRSRLRAFARELPVDLSYAPAGRTSDLAGNVP